MPTLSSLIAPILAPLAKTAVSLLGRGRLPQIQGQLTLQGLHAPVQVLRDRWYVPHIYAQTPEDALFAQGFVQAQERLWQMDFNRRVVAGRLAEVLGEGGLMADRVMRTLGFRRLVEQEAGLMPDFIKNQIQAYCDGINAWMNLAIQKGKLPVEFSLLGYQPEPWVAADTLGFGKLMSWTLAGNWESEFMRGLVIERLGAEKAAELELDREQTWAAILDVAPPQRDPTHAFVGPQASRGAGSNNWVVHGSRTVSGLPLLANDMHLGLTAPSVWFENHLSGGDLQVSGISFPGTCFIIAGHNQHVAWGYTDGFNDVQDLYEEHLRKTPNGQVEYEYQGDWLPAEVRKEQIQVKGGKNVVEEVVLTRHGPIINLMFEKDFPDRPPLALRWTALEPETTFQAVYGMNYARNCAELREALRSFSGPGQNTVYADVNGDIGYTLFGRTPIRAKGQGLVPVPGWTGEYEWTGYIPFEEMPHLQNPTKGYVATANNAHKREPGAFFIAADYCQADRATRIVELLEAQPKIDPGYIQRMQYDQISPSARVMANLLGQLACDDPELQQAAGRFTHWEGRLDPNSETAALYEFTTRRAIRLLLDAHLGDIAPKIQRAVVESTLWDEHSWEWFIHLLETPDSPWFDLGHGEQRDDVLRLALRQTLDERKRALQNRLKSWTWGKLHHLTFRHILGSQKALETAFNRGPFAIGGDGSTIWSSFSTDYASDSGTTVGPPFRFIADLSDLDHCLGMLAPGQSGHPASPHYADGIHPWFHGGYHPMLIRREEVEKNLSARLDLLPGDD